MTAFKKKSVAKVLKLTLKKKQKKKGATSTSMFISIIFHNN